MHTIKLKQTFTTLLIFLFYFYGICLPQGKAEKVSITKDSQQDPANNKQETRFFVETGDLSPEKSLQVLTEENLQRKPLDGEHKSIVVQNGISLKDKEKNVYSRTFPQILFSTSGIISVIREEKDIEEELSLDKDYQSIATEKEISSNNIEKNVSQTTSAQDCSATSASEIQSSPLEQHGIQEPTIDKKPSEDTASDKNFQENISLHEDDQKIAVEENISSVTSPAILSPDKEGSSLTEEEKGDQISVIDNEQQRNTPDEEKTPSLEEEKLPINHQVNTDEKESQDIKENDIPSHVSEPSPTTAYEKETLPESVIEDSENSKEASHVNEDKEGIIINKDMLSDIKEKETLSITSTAVPSTPSPGKGESLVKEEKGTQSSKVPDDQQGIVPDEENIPLLREEKSPINYQSMSNEKTIPQHREDENISSSPSELPTTDVREKESSAIEGTQTDAGESKYLQDAPENGALPSSPINEPSNKTEVEASMPLNRDTQESNEEIHLQKSVGDIKEGEEEIKYTWKIWHSDPTHSVILAVVITLVAAKIGGWTARMIKFPGVVGKLILGMILGNMYLLTGSDYFDFLKTMPFLKMISYFGTLVLLLTAGLTTDLRAILRVGASSFLVCLGGIVAPAGLGIIVGHFLLPDTSDGTKLLLAIILCNSSTGLLLAILSELKAMNTLEGRVIAGATILTDIVIILTFGVVSGVVAKGGVSLLGISVSFGIAICFLVVAVIIIFKYGEKFGNFLTKRLTEGINIPIVVILSLLLAFMFGSVGLHTVIGAFIAGLFLRNVKLRDSDDREHRNVESFIRPFYVILVPILFVRVGAQVDLKSFFSIDAVLLGLAITGAAIVGKMFCSVCPIEKGINRLAIGIGMATKMEGTLILAGIGRDIGILNDTVFSSIIMVIVLTSTICPFLMKVLLLRKNNIRYEGMCIDAEKKELEKVTVN